MRNDNNKAELFSLLAKRLLTLENGLVYATNNESTICNNIYRYQLKFTNEEADTKLFVHLTNLIETVCVSSACILSNDTDIIILAISLFHELKSIDLQ